MCKLELSHLAVPFTRCLLGAWFCFNVERMPGIVLFVNYPSSHPLSSFFFFGKQLGQVFLGMPSRTLQHCRCLCGKKMPYRALKTFISICIQKIIALKGFTPKCTENNTCQYFVGPEILVRAKKWGLAFLKKARTF